MFYGANSCLSAAAFLNQPLIHFSKGSDTSDSHQSVWWGTDIVCSRVQVHSHPGTRPEPRRLPLFLALKWWEQAFQNQTGVFANIFWPSCLPIFISFIFGKRKFPDRGLGIRLFSGQRAPVPARGLRGGRRCFGIHTVVPHLPVDGHPTCGRAWWGQLWLQQRVLCPASLQLWPLPGERRRRVMEAAAQVEGMSRPGSCCIVSIGITLPTDLSSLPGPAD